MKIKLSQNHRIWVSFLNEARERKIIRDESFSEERANEIANELHNEFVCRTSFVIFGSVDAVGASAIWYVFADGESVVVERRWQGRNTDKTKWYHPDGLPESVFVDINVWMVVHNALPPPPKPPPPPGNASYTRIY